MANRMPIRRFALTFTAAGLLAAVLVPGLSAQESTLPSGQDVAHESGQPHFDRPYQMFHPDGLDWHDNPEFPGLKSAFLYGIVSNSAPYTYRLWAREEGYVGLHSHGRTEFITVLSGVLYHATGDGDRSSATRCEVGCFMVVPVGGSHQGWLEAGTILQIHGLGPIDAEHLGIPVS